MLCGALRLVPYTPVTVEINRGLSGAPFLPAPSQGGNSPASEKVRTPTHPQLVSHRGGTGGQVPQKPVTWSPQGTVHPRYMVPQTFLWRIRFLARVGSLPVKSSSREEDGPGRISGARLSISFKEFDLNS